MWKFIKNLFKKNNSPKIVISTPIKTPPIGNNTPPNSTSKIKKIAILVGHGNSDGGATAFNGVEEHAYNSSVAEFISQSDLGKAIKVFYKSNRGWVPTYLKIGLFNPDMTIELHLNAASGSAIGCEVLCLKGDEKSATIGRNFAKSFTEKFNRKARRELGINFIASGDRGYGNLKGCKAIAPIAILVEPFFCSTPSEWISPEEYSKWLASWIKDL